MHEPFRDDWNVEEKNVKVGIGHVFVVLGGHCKGVESNQ